ncbi:uncharacterized protein LOC129585576 [Paramacrobiotus metropolitanus]|uniref:uncharacterized protein LOC129585576 n=1 Tax=Paramacrobiotus metropolitanus TaxID=2943436 RepID=UPI0024459795|nr:uncharacterized protein LOC129585576 [Paramacrobiotus metropolitanus]
MRLWWWWIVAFALMAAVTARKVDRTRKSGEYGRAVVEAVVEQIGKVYGDDKDFLRRLACFASQYGTVRQDLRRSATGIWQISPERFRSTQNVQSYSFLAAEHDRIYRSFGIQWRSVRQDDLKIPLYSGLAARLCMLLCGTIEPVLPIPESDSDLASYWQSCAQVTLAEDVVRSRMPACTDRQCGVRMDICVMVDASGSIGTEDFQRSRDFVRDLLRAYDPQQNANNGKRTRDSVRTHIVVFSSAVQQVTDFKSTTAEKLAAIASAPHLQGGTATADAVHHCYGVLQNRPTTTAATPKVNLLLTDGQSNEWRYESLDSILQKSALASITSYAVGVGPAPNQAELLTIAGNRAERVFSVTAATDLQHRLGQIHKATCRTPQTPRPREKVLETLGKDETRLLKLQITEDTEISLDVPVGGAKVYYSLSHENPSPALRDGVCTVPGCVIRYPRQRPRRDVVPSNATGNQSAPVNVYISIIGTEDLNNITFSAQPAAENPAYVPTDEPTDEDAEETDEVDTSTTTAEDNTASTDVTTSALSTSAATSLETNTTTATVNDITSGILHSTTVPSEQATIVSDEVTTNAVSSADARQSPFVGPTSQSPSVSRFTTTEETTSVERAVTVSIPSSTLPSSDSAWTIAVPPAKDSAATMRASLAILLTSFVLTIVVSRVT